MATYTDEFLEGSDIALSDHTAAPSAGTWIEFEDSTGSALAIAVQSSNDCASPGGNSNSNRIIDTVSWTPASANYRVKFTVIATPGGDDAASLVARAADSSNYYALTLVGTTQAHLVKKEAGTYSNLTENTFTIAAADVWELELIGTALKAYQNGVERLSATDSTHSAAGSVGIGFGNIGAAGALTINVTVCDINIGWDVDDFILEDIASGGGSKRAKTRTMLGVGM